MSKKKADYNEGDIIDLVRSYKECDLKVKTLIGLISEMKKVSDDIAVENRERDEAAKANAGDPFVEQ